jgi:ABC-type transport system substrate-binding protein
MFPIAASSPNPPDLCGGVYVDEVQYRVIENQDFRVFELLDGTIDMHSGFIDPVHYATFNADPAIDLFEAVRNGYGELLINCRQYPLNITGLRRAFALAFDKVLAKETILSGFSREHDSLIPYCNPWCIEDEFDYHYYTDDSAAGNAILDQLGFEIDPVSGYRLAPNGTPFQVEIAYCGPSLPAIRTTALSQDTLLSLHIDARIAQLDYQYFWEALNNHGNYDIIFLDKQWYDFNLDWLIEDFCSENAAVYGRNPTSFRNETFDAWAEQMQYGTSYDEVAEAVSQMQRILQYNVPALVVYHNTWLQAYRNDRFTGHVMDYLNYVPGPWTLRNIRNLDGSLGGTVTIAIRSEPSSFNHYYAVDDTYELLYGGAPVILRNLYSSLYIYGPDGAIYPDLAQDTLIETPATNPSIGEGHIRFTVDIVHNATWCDGTPLTAMDIAFTFNYAVETNNTLNQGLINLFSVYSPTPFRVVFEFDHESYWAFHDFAFVPIIPYHVFRNDTGIGYEGLTSWNPVYNSTSPLVTSGPFQFSDMTTTYDSHYEHDIPCFEISRNPYWHNAMEHPSRTTTSNETTSTQTSTSEGRALDWMRLGLGLTIGLCTVVTIVALGGIVKKQM